MCFRTDPGKVSFFLMRRKQCSHLITNTECSRRIDSCYRKAFWNNLTRLMEIIVSAMGIHLFLTISRFQYKIKASFGHAVCSGRSGPDGSM